MEKRGKYLLPDRFFGKDRQDVALVLSTADSSGCKYCISQILTFAFPIFSVYWY